MTDWLMMVERLEAENASLLRRIDDLMRTIARMNREMESWRNRYQIAADAAASWRLEAERLRDQSA